MPLYPERAATSIKVATALAVGIGSLALAEKAESSSTDKKVAQTIKHHKPAVGHLAKVSMNESGVHFIVPKGPIEYDLPHPPIASAAREPKVIHTLYIPSTLRYIAGCESDGSAIGKINWKAENPSGASGGLQIEPQTWDNFDGYPAAIDAPPAVQIKKGEQLLAESGTSPWVSSEYCWGKYVNG
ncbi:MAG TPA: transglycosylase family protein [Candidatus Saccharimonadales bacterium]|nr:transglycosylase family protein [Candidatus Saccharimonadales bacterium]